MVFYSKAFYLVSDILTSYGISACDIDSVVASLPKGMATDSVKQDIKYDSFV